MEEHAPATVSMEELQLATRNHGMPLEALRYPITPVGLHYLLVHYDIPLIDGLSWRLIVDGCVDRTIELSLAELRAMPATTRTLTMECAGNGRAQLSPRPPSQPWLVEAVGTGVWTGVELARVLDVAGLPDRAVEVVLTGADRGIEGGVEQSYQRSITVADVAATGALLAYEMNGAPLVPQHGFPLRLVVPGWYGMSNVKWLTALTAIDAPFSGYQQAVSYRLRQAGDEAGEPVTRMLPRALMAPPGIPDFFTRARTVRSGRCVLFGRAWSGATRIELVEVSVDGGATWSPAELEADLAVADGVWIGWSFDWDAAPGEHELCCRATDADGAGQPSRPQWNHGGYVNNAVHRVSVRVVG